MGMYEELRTKIQELGGSVGPDGIGSINIYGGAEVKFEYKLSDDSVRTVSVVPYMVGKGKSNGSPVRKLIAWQYKSEPASPSGWRCFKVPEISQLKPGELPRPADDELPVLVVEDQNCVKKC